MNKRKYEFATELYSEMQTKRFSKVSISDICEHMQCSRQSFYYYFKTIDDCLAYYVKESFKASIKEDYLVSDFFNYFDNNRDFVNTCHKDPRADMIFWDGLNSYLKKLLDIVYSRNINEYLSLYGEQKQFITSYQVAGLIEIAKIYAFNYAPISKEKCIAYSKAMTGSAEDMRQIMLRFNR